MPSTEISCNVAVEGTESVWYGKLVVDKIRYKDDDSPVTINKFLGFAFKSPIHTEKFTFEINGDLGTDPDRYTKSFTLSAGRMPSGTVAIDCAAAPDQALAHSLQPVFFERGNQTRLWDVPGQYTPYALPVGNYKVTAGEMANPDETLVSVARVSLGTITSRVGTDKSVEGSGTPTTLELNTVRGANLKVRGFPDFLSFGGLSDLVDPTGKDFIAARASSVYKYAGNDGKGDPSGYLTDDQATTKTIQLAADIESSTGGGDQVLPVMISYHSFGNLILSLTLANKHGKKSVPTGYIVNPDFLGACQQQNIASTYHTPARRPLTKALKNRNITGTTAAAIPAEITDTIRGHVLAVNWLFLTLAKSLTFGWQVKLWGLGSGRWLYSRDPKDNPIAMTKRTAEYVRLVGAYNNRNPSSSIYQPGFLAVDRYEADDFTIRGYANGWSFSSCEWLRFYAFCGALSLDHQMPVMPWQILAS
ncbi:hypothetical protein B0H63DRAFT_524871 [Podospora didyma]|uniref:Uncharacterized protein n=1 Tax=Podospora didyma TaxID=330526 RepID=A0AAE0KJC7_9PEZI|nr:hypothetical protein B0H63DRAFT_524871 [Podospora didyma]